MRRRVYVLCGADCARRAQGTRTSLHAALEAARAGLARGCGEVVLSGIDLGAWRDDDAVRTGAAGLGGAARLPELVAAVAELDGLRRVRLSSIEPRHVTQALLEQFAHPRVARHLHVPLQSADDGVLRAMRRPYTFEKYLRAVEGLHDVPGGAMLSTDVIVGFPTEDEAAFARTLEVLESGLFGRVHVFGVLAAAGDGGGGAAGTTGRGGQGAHGARAGGRRGGRLCRAPRRPRRAAEVLAGGAARRPLQEGYSSQNIRFALRGPARRGELVTAVADALADDGVHGEVVGPAGRPDAAAGEGGKE